MIQTILVLPSGARIKSKLEVLSPEDVERLVTALSFKLVSDATVKIETSDGWVIVPPHLASRSYFLIVGVPSEKEETL